jgi:3-deoxy-D-manno-octulosonate 8-phosphate phosphatase (KDO 8-P phosphatase)
MSEIDYGRLRLLLLDVDGVLTDGRIMLTPGGEEIKSFHVRDGSAMKYWTRAGGKLALLTGRGSNAVKIRAGELGVHATRLSAKDKLPAFREILTELGIEPHETIVVGDDLVDIPLLRRAGLGVAVADAAEELRARADYVTAAPGGAGAVRELIEMVMKRTGQWDRVLSGYLDEPRS